MESQSDQESESPEQTPEPSPPPSRKLQSQVQQRLPTFSHEEAIAIVRPSERGVFNSDPTKFVEDTLTILRAHNRVQLVEFIEKMKAEVAAGEDPENLYKLVVQITCRIIHSSCHWSGDHILGYQPPLNEDLIIKGHVARAANTLFIPILSKRAGEFASKYAAAVIVSDQTFDDFRKLLPKATVKSDPAGIEFAMELPPHMIVNPKWLNDEGAPSIAVWLNSYSIQWHFTCKKDPVRLEATVEVRGDNVRVLNHRVLPKRPGVEDTAHTKIDSMD